MGDNTAEYHSGRKHALLSASAAHRWMNCTPSARLNENIEDKSSVYANEGTLAHEIAELFLRKDGLCNISDIEFNHKLDELMANPLFTDDMIDYVSVYSEYCNQQLLVGKILAGTSVMLVEQKIDYSNYVREGFGTNDCSIISGDTLEVIDLKYGKGVRVSAAHNPQLMLYALGVLNAVKLLFCITNIRVTIVQPRLDSIDSWDITYDDLMEWANNDLSLAAEQAWAGSGVQKSGDWCKFCGVKNRCRLLADENLAMARYDFRPASLLSDKEICEVLKKAPSLSDWASSVYQYALEASLNNGAHFDGFKVVNGRPTSKIIDTTKAQDIIIANTSIGIDEITNISLKSITELKKILGKQLFEDLLSPLVSKTEGPKHLVPESDKRPEALSKLDSAKQDFQ